MEKIDIAVYLDRSLPSHACFRFQTSWMKPSHNQLNCTAFAPYRVRPFEFAPTLCRVRPTLFKFDPIKSSSPLD